MTNKNKFLLDTERLKKLEPIMRECGVKNSAWISPSPLEIYDLSEIGIDKRGEPYFIPLGQEGYFEFYQTFDHADIESILPDECFSLDLFNSIYNKLAKQDIELHNRICELLEAIRHTRSQKKLEYMTDLAILLHDNGIELKKVER